MTPRDLLDKLKHLGQTWYQKLSDPGESVVSPWSKRVEISLVLVLFSFSWLLRGLGLRLGLPYFHHWDETLITTSARQMIERGDDSPSNFFYGAPLMRLIVKGYQLSQSIGLVSSPDEVTLRWVGRIIASGLSASGAVAVYLATRAITANPRVGILAGVIFASAQEPIWHGRFAVTDGIVTSLTAWVLATASMYFRTAKMSWAIATIIMSAITFSFKLTGLATVLLPLGVLWLRPLRTENEKDELAPRFLLAATIPILLGIFFYLNPHMRSEWQRAIQDIEGIARHYKEGHVKPFCEREPGFEHLFSAWRYLLTQSFSSQTLIASGFGLLALIGLGSLLRQGSWVTLIGVIHAMGIIFSMAWPNRAYLVRQYLPAVPILCVGVAHGLWVLWSYFTQSLTSIRHFRWALIAFVGSNVVLSGYQSVMAQVLSQDSRIRAIKWILDQNQTQPTTNETGSTGPTIAINSAVAGGTALGGHGELRKQIEQLGVRLIDAPTADAAARSKAHFIVIASHRDLKKIWPYEEQWAYRQVPGYRHVASFEFSPYEHRLDLIPTWDGHVTARVLEKSQQAEE